jgi:hypothetical protein
MNHIARGCLAFVLLLGLERATAADWPQWLGPQRNGTSPEKGLLTSWTAGSGPKVLWKVDGGEGYSAIAVVGNRAYTLVQRGNDELAIALDTANGSEVWKKRIGAGYKKTSAMGRAVRRPSMASTSTFRAPRGRWPAWKRRRATSSGSTTC